MSHHVAALTRLLILERSALHGLIRRIVGSSAAAEDVTQTLFLKLQRVDDATEIQDRRAYLFRLASNLAIDRRRTETREKGHQAEIEDILWVEDPAPGAERTAMARLDLERVARALEALPEPTRSIFQLNRFGQQTQREIAARYGISTTMVERHIRRALEALSRARAGG